MTEPTPSPADAPVEPPTDDPPPAEPVQEDDTDTQAEPETANAEAARYRRQLRVAEQERDQLRERLDTMQRAQVEDLAAGRGNGLTKPAGIWAAGTTLADLLDDTGQVDPTKVKTAVSHAVDTLGLAVDIRVARPGNYVPKEGLGNYAGSGGNSWQRLLQQPADANATVVGMLG